MLKKQISCIYIVRLILLPVLGLLALNSRAQNVPGNAVQAPAPTGTPASLPAAYSAGYQPNYIRTWQPRKPFSLESDVNSTSRTADEVSVVNQFVDGPGRPLQSVTWQGAPLKKDLVAPVKYDAYGREQLKYLAYTDVSATTGGFKINPFADQGNFYTNTYKTDQPAYTGEQFFYSQTDYEASPLNRVLKTYAPGNSWVGTGRGVSRQYLVNTAADHVRAWNIDFTALVYGDDNTGINIPYSTGEYAAGQLYKTVTTDEQGKSVVEFKDKEDHIVLKQVQVDNGASGGDQDWLYTYYIYDKMQQLRCVLPPKVVADMLARSSFTLNAGLLKELCFRYEYDGRRRMIAKKVPGAAWTYLVYDQRDRLAFTQDGNMKSKGQWLYTFYDDLNRPVQTGIMSGYGGTWGSLQAYMTGLTNSTGTSVNGTTVATISPDLVLSSWNGTPDYQATNSILMQPGFTADGSVGSVIAEIVSASGSTTFAYTQTVSNRPDPSIGTFTPLTITGYDNYNNVSTGKQFNSSLAAKPGTGGNANAEAAASGGSNLTMGLVTNTRVRTLEDPNNLSAGNWLETVTWYDDKGRAIQMLNDNYKGGVDVISNRYEFTGKVVSSYLVHNNASGGITNLRVQTDYLYDHAGRLVKTSKTVNDDPTTARTLSSSIYDALGQLKEKQVGQKRIGGVLSTTPMEDDQYAYNIRGWLKGINWTYIGSAGGSSSLVNTGSNKWFGMDLSYDWGFTSSQYNGNISGMRWMSAGDSKDRAYGYSYDGANRLLVADFSQNDGGWSKGNGVDFSMRMGDGASWRSAYDENGNIKGMAQMGMVGTQSQLIDDLRYNYYAGSNKLSGVQDAQTTDNKLGDFVDKNTAGDDYGYDVNGNLLTDKNKRLSGGTGIDIPAGSGAIVYNHLNLPWQISVLNDDGSQKGTITYIYDATGNKLEKRVNELAGAANNQTAKQTSTDYLAGFIYENNLLQFFGQEEGRIRPTRDGNNVTTGYAYDYFLKDHLGNTRMVLTDELQVDQYPVATLEAGAVATEKNYYDIQDANIVAKTGVTGFTSAAGENYLNNNGNPPYNTNPNSNVNAESQNLYKLNGNGTKMGLGITLKVMAGDQLKVYGKSYYFQNSVNNTSNSPLTATDIITSLLGGATGGVTAAHGAVTAAQVNAQAGAALGGFLTGNANANSSTPTKPRAYINYLLFDEQFHSIGSYASQVGDNSIIKDHSADLANIQVPKNGYIYIYCSNESPVDVFFDNLQVVDTHGPLMEETHYYPFGLTMTGISDKALKTNYAENKNRWNKGSELQNKEFSDGSGLEMYETHYRMLDPQLGRFWQIDPKPDYAQSLYSSMDNNPISFNDPLGDTLLNKADQRQANRITKNINSTNKNLSKQATKLNSQIAKADAKGNTSKADGLRAKLADINGRIATNNGSLAHLNAIVNDQTQAYTFNQLQAGSTIGGTTMQSMNINGNNQNVVVMGVTSDVNAVHEMTHAFQGGIEHSIILNQQGAAFPGANLFAQQMTNAISESQAYQAQYALDPGSMPPSTGGYVPHNMNSINAFYIGGINQPGTTTTVYPNVQDMVNTIIQFIGFLR